MAFFDLFKSAARSGMTALGRKTLHSLKHEGLDSWRRELKVRRQQNANPAQAKAPSSPHFPSPGSEPIEWPVERFGLPDFSYRPHSNAAPDPGEVVWTWVPYEEHDGRGKDRPVLVVGMEGEYVFFVQLTSKDHADQGIRKDEFGTWWIDLGTGAWDAEGRPSEAKLSIIWVVHESQIRREGAALPADRFKAVISAIRKLHQYDS